MTGNQLAMLAGAGFGIGVWLILRGVLRPDPHLGSALANLSPRAERAQPAPSDLTGRIGRCAQRNLHPALVGRAAPADLALLGVDPARHTGEKVLGAVFGLMAPALISTAFGMLGLTLPFLIPAAAGLGFAALLFIAPDLSARSRARQSRVEFSRALAAYMDLVALERTAAAGVTEAMESAAEVADSPAFLRIRETLTQARWAGVSPWEGLAVLGGEVGVAELVDVANIMRLAGEQSSASATNLKARAASIRNTLAEDAHASANAAGERMILPLALLAFVYLAILAAPGILRVLAAT